MRKIIIALSAILLVSSCSKVPLTGRRQMNILPESDLIGMSLSEYKDFLSKNPPIVSTNNDAIMVKSVGSKIQSAVTQYLAKNKLSKRLAGYKWEYNLVKDSTVNAWCMPGGKVVVYSGLLPVTQTEGALACVMGHEIAHAVARHGNERMSQGLLVQAGGIALSVALSQKPQMTQDLFLQSYGITSQLGMLNYSRTHESEADKMGLVFMAIAGYDPSEAIRFWERMEKKSGNKPPQILSTHPNDATRIADIKAFLPEAMKYFKKK